MRRFYFFALVVALVFSLSFSTAMAEMFNGPYIGVNLGYGSTDYKTDVGPGTLTLDSLSGSGVNAGLFAGYGATSPQGIYFGIEAEGSWSSGDVDVDLMGAKAELSQDWTLGLTARLGGMLTETILGYVRAGWVATKFEAEVPPLAWSQKKTFTGPRIGLGLEFPINKDVSFRTDYTYTWYQSKDLDDAGVPVMSVKPSEQLFRIGFAYNF
ncbi:MAG: porin family protein [Syntrophales bacterium]|nr:porin family protein [Syntrophales bacterium]MCK9527308.1 porin family protein [Syntrophales bacterium]MDX9921222.1 porin family protein [Syntrophales bacterium]